jgi:hypothetical protein
LRSALPGIYVLTGSLCGVGTLKNPVAIFSIYDF